MRQPFRIGDQKRYRTQVTADKVAQFHGQVVHPYYSTFALAQDAEWACRLFVLDMKEEDEEGIGTYLSVHHISAVPQGSEVEIVATLLWVRDQTVHCSYEVWWENQRVAYGEQTQKVLKKR
ncbi:MAG: hotdog domain-containing protein [Bacteroidia bacterium]